MYVCMSNFLLWRSQNDDSSGWPFGVGFSFGYVKLLYYYYNISLHCRTTSCPLLTRVLSSAAGWSLWAIEVGRCPRSVILSSFSLYCSFHDKTRSRDLRMSGQRSVFKWHRSDLSFRSCERVDCNARRIVDASASRLPPQRLFRQGRGERFSPVLM